MGRSLGFVRGIPPGIDALRDPRRRARRVTPLGVALVLAACSHSQKGSSEPKTSTSAASQAAGAKGAYPGKSPSSSQPSASEPQKPERDPQAIAALDRMGAYLRTLTRFAVHAETTTDEVLLDGQKIQFAKTIDLKVQRPNKFRADVSSDRKHRQLFYDGETLTVYGEKVGYYAQAKAPPTINETLQEAQNRLGIATPLADLFYWGTAPSDNESLIGAIDVGPSRLKGGVETEQYAFRRSDIDFQLWIEKGERPLPRRLIITTKTEPSQPQYTVDLAWDLAPRFDDNVFAFSPPPEAKRIIFREQANPSP
jgi:hypothetical protein